MRDMSTLIGLGKRAGAIFLSLLLILALLPLGFQESAVAQESSQTQADDKIALQQGRDFVPGEAIVVVREGASANTMRSMSVHILDTAEPLMTVSEEAYQETVGEEATEESLEPASERARVMALNTGPDLSIRRVTSESLSTDQLLDALAEDSRVLMVQPNYIYKRDADLADVNTYSTQNYAAKALPSSDTNDLTGYQWGNSNSDAYSYMDGKQLGFDINPSEWEAGRTDNTKKNATGVVAILDSGVDYTHPDLKDIFVADMRDYVSYGGKYGYCSVEGDDPTEPMDKDGHGTHCAGVVASEWNTYGTSGVASGVKLVAVRAINKDKPFTDANAIRGYEYLAAAMRNGLDLKAVNNSWGGAEISQAFSLAVTMLGNLGAITLLASGNDAQDMDVVPDTSASTHFNPFSVVVNSSTMKGSVSSFSNYGRFTTDFYVPGSTILSTYPTSDLQYLPEAVGSTSSQNIVYESFTNDGGSRLVETFNDEGGLKSIGDYTTASYFDEMSSSGNKYSWSVRGADMEKGQVEDDSEIQPSKYLYAHVDVPSVSQADLSYLGFRFSVEESPNLNVVYVSVECEDSAGETVMVGGFSRGAEGNEWGFGSFNLKRLCEEAGVTPRFENDKLKIKMDFFTAEGAQPTDSMSFNIDAFGLGASDAAVPYAYRNGTSMSTPAATGAAAILACDDDTSLPASEQARLRAAKLKGSVRPVSEMEDRCTSGGALDLAYHFAEDYTPVISDAQTYLNSQNEYELIVSGYFFGEQTGKVRVSGQDVEVKHWSDTEATAVCPVSMKSGLHKIEVTSNAQGRTGKNGFILNFLEYPNDSSTPLFEFEYPLPTAEQGFSPSTMTVKMLGLAGSLYLMPLESEGALLSKCLFRLDPDSKTWTRVDGFPDILGWASMTSYKGKLLITGLSSTFSQLLYSYDPLSGAWEEMSAASIPLYASIVNCNESLYLVGGQMLDESGQPSDFNYDVFSYDVENDTRKRILTLDFIGRSMCASAFGDTLIIGDGNYPQTQGKLAAASTTTRSVADLAQKLPSFDETRSNDYGIAVVERGVMVSGVIAQSDGVNLDDQDTYLLELDSGEQSLGRSSSTQEQGFVGFDKRASYAQLLYPSSTAYDGKLYTYGFSAYEPGAYVLRATAVETLPQPGDLYTIEYHNVEQGEHSNVSSYTATSLPLSLSAASNRATERFVGWYDNEQLMGNAVTQISEGTTSNLNFWAKWEPIEPIYDPADDSSSELSKTSDIPSFVLMVTGGLILLSAALSLLAYRRRFE